MNLTAEDLWFLSDTTDMKNDLFRNIFFGLMCLAFTACVSVNIPSNTGSPAKDIKCENVGEPFKELKIKTSDRAWVSSKTGNSISYISECYTSVDSTLEQLENESLVALNKLKIIQSKNLTYNAREALSTISEGEVDGVLVKTQTLVFKKNGCNFTLSYGGIRSNFESELSHFQKFTETFRAP